MKKIMFPLLATILMIGCKPAKTNQMENESTHNANANQLTDTEKSEGWRLLFDGQTTKGWHTYNKSGMGKAWKVEGGTLRLDAASKSDWQTAEGGDIVTDETFENFDLMLDWKLAPKGNSGIMFYVQENPQYQHAWHTGPEIQVLDNAGHADAKITKHRAGDLYDLISASKETVKPAGEWNTVRIVANGGKLDTYLNGAHVINTTLWNDEWQRLVAGSKFKDMPGFAKFKSGKIALQDHGDNVWFRNIKIRKL